MTILRSTRIAPVAFAAMLCVPALAFAQTTTAPTPSTRPSTATTAPDQTKDIQARVEQHITQLHAQLKITPQQEDEWKKFADVMRGNAHDMEGVIEERTQQYPSMNALQNMQSYQKVAQTHADHLEKLTSAFETLYDALPQPQKQLADQVFKARIKAQPQHASSTSGHGRAE